MILESEPYRRLSYSWHALGELVKLTVVHDGFEPESLVAPMVSQWPRVLSNLKTLLETGDTLPESPEPLPPAQLDLTKRRRRLADPR